MKVFASPGIDSHSDEFGVYNSGAGMRPEFQSAKALSSPFDWQSNNPLIDHHTGRLIGTSPATTAPDASTIRIRRRGVSPWGGFHPGRTVQMANSGGNIDTNAGAGSMIAGGKGAASTFVRVGGPAKSNEGQKLPVLPKSITRGGAAAIPAGGGPMPGTGAAAPISPKIYGFPAIIKVLLNPHSAGKV